MHGEFIIGGLIDYSLFILRMLADFSTAYLPKFRTTEGSGQAISQGCQDVLLGILPCAIWGNLMHSANICWNFLHVLCLIQTPYM